MNLRTLWRPAYIFRPQQLVARATERFNGRGSEGRVRVPWGTSLIVSRHDAIGRGLLRRGVHELPVTELLWRLTDPDDLALDVGANVGYFTSLFAARAERVLAFEPHPTHVDRIARAMTSWDGVRWAKVELLPNAVSDRMGEATLSMPEDFKVNEGLASLSLDVTAGAAITVQGVTIDDVLQDRRVGVMKIDVEGHELAALQGAERALSAGRVRDIVFEDHAPLPTDVSRYLTRHGYTVFGLAERPMGVDLVAPEGAAVPRWDAPMYLATLAPERARRLMKPRRWRSLRPSRPLHPV